MRALLRDAEDQTLIALEAEEAVYDPEDQLLLLYAASGTNYEVSRIVRANADSMIKELRHDVQPSTSEPRQSAAGAYCRAGR